MSHKKCCKKNNKTAYNYSYNNSTTQNVNSCGENNSLISFNLTTTNKNINFNGTDSFKILIDGDYDINYIVNAITSSEDGIISFSLLKNGIVIPGSTYSTKSIPNTSVSISGNVKFKACKYDIIQLTNNTKVPIVVSLNDSPFEDKSITSGSVAPNSITTINSPSITTKSNSSNYVCITTTGNCIINNVSDGINNYIKATGSLNENINVEIWYLDGLTETDNYNIMTDFLTTNLAGTYHIKVYNISGTSNPSLDSIGTFSKIGLEVINTITTTKKNDLAIMSYACKDDSSISLSFPNFLLDLTNTTADVYSALGGIGTYNIKLNNSSVNDVAVSVAIKFADNQMVCNTPVSASINIDRL